MTTTDDRLAALSSRPKRDKFPARSARILTAGLSAAAILGVSSAITATSPANAGTTDPGVSPDVLQLDPGSVGAPSLVDPTMITPPAAAVPATQQPPAQPATIAPQPVATAPAATAPAATIPAIAPVQSVAPQEPARVVLDVPVVPVQQQPSARSGGSN